MALKIDALIITILVLTFIRHSAQSRDIVPETLTKWWKPIKHLRDPNVEEIGKHFVRAYNALKNKSFEYESVIQGESQLNNHLPKFLYILRGPPQPQSPKLTTTAYQPPMAPRFHILLLILSLSFIPGQFYDITVARKALVGGWKPIKNPKDPVIQEIGKFAVTTYNKDNQKNLVYQDVVKGQSQVVAGTNYQLTIAATDNGAVNHYEAIVFDQPWTHTRNLTSFKRL
ncbi:hypothetical protein AgCh_032254 [Apium graveolens]